MNIICQNHKQFIDIEGTTLEMLYIKTGVPQGSVPDLLLFIIYMNDISAGSNMFNPIIYADDPILTSILSAFNIHSDTNNNNSQPINSELN